MLWGLPDSVEVDLRFLTPVKPIPNDSSMPRFFWDGADKNRHACSAKYNGPYSCSKIGIPGKHNVLYKTPTSTFSQTLPSIHRCRNLTKPLYYIQALLQNHINMSSNRLIARMLCTPQVNHDRSWNDNIEIASIIPLQSAELAQCKTAVLPFGALFFHERVNLRTGFIGRPSSSPPQEGVILVRLGVEDPDMISLMRWKGLVEWWNASDFEANAIPSCDRSLEICCQYKVFLTVFLPWAYTSPYSH